MKSGKQLTLSIEATSSLVMQPDRSVSYICSVFSINRSKKIRVSIRFKDPKEEKSLGNLNCKSSLMS